MDAYCYASTNKFTLSLKGARFESTFFQITFYARLKRLIFLNSMSFKDSKTVFNVMILKV